MHSRFCGECYNSFTMAVKIETLDRQCKEDALSALFAVAHNLKGDQAAAEFIKYFLTESEQVTIGRRIQIATMLQSGVSQKEIRERLRVSPSTFSRTRKWLERETVTYGEAVKARQRPRDGEAAEQPEKAELPPIAPFSFAALKRKYPMESLLSQLSSRLRGR